MGCLEAVHPCNLPPMLVRKSVCMTLPGKGPLISYCKDMLEQYSGKDYLPSL